MYKYLLDDSSEFEDSFQFDDSVQVDDSIQLGSTESGFETHRVHDQGPERCALFRAAGYSQ